MGLESQRIDVANREIHSSYKGLIETRECFLWAEVEYKSQILI